jgi:hypothetical protein
MNCAWCLPSDNGTDGICAACMLLYFGVDPASIYAEIVAGETQQAVAWSNGKISTPSDGYKPAYQQSVGKKKGYVS